MGVTDDCRQWDCFKFSDYTLRQKSAKTFNVRHFPLSDGDDDHNFDGEYDFDWEPHGYTPRKKKRKIMKPRKKSEVVTKATVTSSPLMVYDVEQDCLVPL